MPRAKKAALSKAKAKTKKASRRVTNVKATAKPASKRAKPKAAPARLRQPGPGPTGPYLGQVALLPFNFAPRGWAPCSGQLLPISQNVPLFQLIGKTYGGNGVSSFALPNLPPRTPYSGPWYYIAIAGVLPPH
jgi:hypothetical protein